MLFSVHMKTDMFCITEPVRRPPRSFQKALCNSVLRHLGRRTNSRFAPDGSSSSSDDGQARFDHKKTHSR